MQQLTLEGSRVVNDLSQRYGFTPDAVTHMMFAVLNGNGGMAQFSHPEFGGSGQWMQGGMIMLGDMFNHGLKNQVGSLCNELSNILANQPDLLRSGSFQSQSQSGGSQQHQANGSPMGESSLFVPDPDQNWWPREFGSPSSSGSQNNMQYAYFPNHRRLAVKTGSDIWVYDSLDHQIGGFSQQQGMGSSIIFSSQYGTISLASLPVVSRNGQAVQSQPQHSTSPPPMPSSAPNSAPSKFAPSNGGVNEAGIFDAIVRLGELRDKGFLTVEEFNAKKIELLGRL